MVESDVKIYVSSLSGNKEVKKRQQRVMMILESKNIKYTVIDITEPTQEKEKDFMQANATEKGVTVSDQNPRHPLPPQMFNGELYCGDYNSFELANENDQLENFLKIEVKNGTMTSTPVPVIQSTEETNGKIMEEDKPVVVQEDEPIVTIEPSSVEDTELVNDAPENHENNTASEPDAPTTESAASEDSTANE